jgi:hypothetical protein
MSNLAALQNVLWRNAGQVLTPELILGVLQGAMRPPDQYIDLSLFSPAQSGRYVFAAERFADTVSELRPLHQAHWLETEKHRHGLPLQFDYAGTAEYDRLGEYVHFTARREGELIGYCGYRIRYSTHTQTLFASEDALFLRADARGGRTSFRFLQYMEDCLVKLGVREFHASGKLINSADRMLIKFGFVPVATQMVKFVGGGNAENTQR